ncbi:MAG: PAS domain-containing protein [Actinomycetota bacterium]|nr:PAS domain-containing protein [Actinomycetota bacterium]
MTRLTELLEYLDVFGFVVLAVVSWLQWRRQGGRPAMWVTLTFGVLAAVALVGLVTPEDPDGLFWGIVQRITIGTLVLFPYFLFRFMASFGASSRGLDRLAMIATGVVGVWALLLPTLPAPGESRSTGFAIFLLVFLVQWAGLLLLVAAKLWRAGRNQVTVARRRMRLLSMGSLAMAVALVVAVTPAGGSDSPGISLAVQAFALGSAAMFLLGFAPPAFLRTAWRRPEEEAMQAAVAHLMTASSLDEISHDILPHSARIVAARGAALLDDQGSIIGCFTQNPADVSPLEDLIEHRLGDRAAGDGEVVERRFPFGSLIVWVSAYTPFFGREEFELFTTLGVLAGLSLERSAVVEKERRVREALERTNAELAQREVQLAEAQEVAHLGSWEWDVDENTVVWSDELYRIFGVDREEFEATYEAFLEIVHPDDREMVAQIVQRAVEDKTDYTVEHRVIHQGGDLRYIYASGRIITGSDDRVQRLVGVAQDVTERVAHQKMAEDYDRRLREAALRQQQALQINDNVVQGLTVAKYAQEMDRPEQAADAIDRTLEAARRIISDLLKERTDEKPLGPGDLVREHPARASDRDPTSS